MDNKRVFINSRKIRMLLFDRKLTQTSVAERAKLNPQLVNTVINRGSCTFATLERMAEAIEVNAQDLIIS